MSHRLVLAVAVTDRLQFVLWHTAQELCFNVPEQSSVCTSPSPCWQYVSNCLAFAVFSCPCFLKIWLLDKDFGEFYTQVEQ